MVLAGHIYRGLQARALEPSSRTALAEAGTRTLSRPATSPRLRGLPGTRLRGHGQGAAGRCNQPEQRSLWGFAPWGRLPGGGRLAPPPPGPCGKNLAVSVNGTPSDYAILPRQSTGWRGKIESRGELAAPDRGGGGWVESLGKPGLGLRLEPL